MYIDTCIVTTDRHTFKIWRNKLMKSKDKQINVWRRYIHIDVCDNQLHGPTYF